LLRNALDVRGSVNLIPLVWLCHLTTKGHKIIVTLRLFGCVCVAKLAQNRAKLNRSHQSLKMQAPARLPKPGKRKAHAKTQNVVKHKPNRDAPRGIVLIKSPLVDN
jgi:hypothetical protein